MAHVGIDGAIREIPARVRSAPVVPLGAKSHVFVNAAESAAPKKGWTVVRPVGRLDGKVRRNLEPEIHTLA